MAILAILAFVAAGSCILGLIAGYQHGRRAEKIAERMRRYVEMAAPFPYQGTSGGEGLTRVEWD